ncbi:MAG: glycosyltransferase [Solirubrobacterales bacterium]|jgi:hypothetical protein|nr:glycosyltransferase [Solirubrobacterales bacterium]
MVSLLMAAYNHERFIVDAVESALAVEWPRDRLEIVVMDDGSTDSTAQLLAPYGDRVRVIHQPNQGLHAAVGRLMDEARGDVIVTGPAGDDMAVPGRVRLLVDGLRANPTAGLVYGDMEVIDDSGRTTARSYMDLHQLRRPSGRIRGQLLQGNFVSGGGCAMRACLKDVFHPIPEYAAWEDFWWAWSISGVADVAHVPAITYRYRQHDANMAHGVSGARAVEAVLTELRFRRWMFGAIRPSEVTTDELLHGVHQFWLSLAYASEEGGKSFAECLPSDAADEAAAAAHFADAAGALAAGDVFGAALSCARGAAASPRRLEDTSLMRAVVAAQAARPTLPPLGTRRFVVLVDGDELVARPGLLDAFGRTFGDDDDVTLLIHTPTWSTAQAASLLGPLVAEAGLDGDDGPDMVAVTHLPGDWPAMQRRIDARLSEHDRADRSFPTFGSTGIDALRTLERRTAQLGPSPWLSVRAAAVVV